MSGTSGHSHEHHSHDDPPRVVSETTYAHNMEEIAIAVKQAAAINDARIKMLEDFLGFTPDPLEILSLKVTLLADYLLREADASTQYAFEWDYQKRLEEHLSRVEEKAREKLGRTADSSKGDPG